ncbi:hypothetical protein RB195_001722 [Necator americanus]|uniref:Uncharacterized protein n=1 Tax=Necator americanus TaxID=51031 RepID=A0ABR1DII7_NECAM
MGFDDVLDDSTFLQSMGIFRNMTPDFDKATTAQIGVILMDTQRTFEKRSAVELFFRFLPWSLPCRFHRSSTLNCSSSDNIYEVVSKVFPVFLCSILESKMRPIRLSLDLWQIQLETNAPTCSVEFGQHSFRLTDARCSQNDVISKAQWCSCRPSTSSPMSSHSNIRIVFSRMAVNMLEWRNSGREDAVQLSKYLYVLRDGLVVQGFYDRFRFN